MREPTPQSGYRTRTAGGSAGKVAILALALAAVSACGGPSAEQEAEYLAAVESIGMTERTALQAGEDACAGESVEWAVPSAPFSITGATSRGLADSLADVHVASIELAAEMHLC
jgi:hypothetical protein